MGLLIFSLIFAVVSAELALRVAITRLPVSFLIYVNPALKDRSPESWNRIRAVALPMLNGRKEDPDTGWIFKPNERRVEKNEDGEPYDVKTSPEGFFTPDVPDTSTPQLITVGDSFLSTFYVRRPIQDVLKAELGVPVYNLAAGGWSTPGGVQASPSIIQPADATTLEHFQTAGASFDLRLVRGQVFMDNDQEFFQPGGGYYQYMQAYFESLVRLKATIEQDRARMVLVWIPSQERVSLPADSLESDIEITSLGWAPIR